MPFGGAGPLHAAALADELGMHALLCPRASGVLCALGLAAAAPRRDAARTVMLSGEALDGARALDASARASCCARGAARRWARSRRRRARVRYELRYAGQSFELGVEEERRRAARRCGPASCARRSRRRTRSATATATRRPRWSW